MIELERLMTSIILAISTTIIIWLIYNEYKILKDK